MHGIVQLAGLFQFLSPPWDDRSETWPALGSGLCLALVLAVTGAGVRWGITDNRQFKGTRAVSATDGHWGTLQHCNYYNTSDATGSQTPGGGLEHTGKFLYLQS